MAALERAQAGAEQEHEELLCRREIIQKKKETAAEMPWLQSSARRSRSEGSDSRSCRLLRPSVLPRRPESAIGRGWSRAQESPA